MRKFTLPAVAGVLALSLAACGLSAQQIRANAIANANDFAGRSQGRYSVVDCSGRDSDKEGTPGYGYVTCTLLDAKDNGKSVNAECGYLELGIGCKIKEDKTPVVIQKS
jgi:hypothetical protein